MPRPVYPGIEFELGGRVLVIPPLSLGQVQIYRDKIQDRLSNLTQDNLLAASALFLDVIHAAISRNYPEITDEEVSDWVDLGNMMTVFEAVMDVSGLRRREIEEKKAIAAAPSAGNG